jgi:large subunit ribosomal protein L30
LKQIFIKITLVKSVIGRLPKHRSTIVGLGLRRINDFVVLEKTDIILGMIKKVNYLVKTEVL